MKQIRITTIAEMIEFINATNYPFEKYLELVNAYTEQPLFWIGENSKPKLIEWINENELKINSNAELPLFANNQ